MFTYVFDLDDTLLRTSKLFSTPHARDVLKTIKRDSLQNSLNTYQKIIPPDPVLIKQLIELNGTKFLFTNGSRMHGYCGMSALGISPYFTGQLDSNSSNILKPNPHVYHLLENSINNITKQHQNMYSNSSSTQIIFFDDQYVNLIYPKKRGWFTVWITNQPDKSKTYADLQFTNIYDAIHFFIKMQNLQKRGKI